ncbi:putative transporter like protein [Verticillium longisporum]|uniref:Putative transporter like protein n=1 Tax=Verticillium longisporum TaxID=100787 RepID=A0A8I2Z1K7_VERLO|nr:putative transporter like protein [Verticillium longisporum]
MSSEKQQAALRDSDKPIDNFVEASIMKGDPEDGLAREGADYSGAVKKTSPEEIALVRKLDWHIMPTLWSMYFLNYLDRNAIAQARLDGLEDDLGLVGSQYNTCISILFVGYLLMQVPSNMLMSSKYVRPSIYMGICMMTWAVVSACTALVHNYAGLVAVRFFLGITEAPFYPGALGNHGLAGWKWLFIIEGCVTFGVAIIGMFTLADSPLTTRWLTPEQRQLAHDRMLRDTVGLEESKGAKAGFMQAVRDPRLWALCFIQNMHLSACSFNNFFPTVVGSLGFGRTMTLVLTCPPYLVSGIFGYLWGMSSGRFNERTWHITIGMSIAIVGFVISCATMNVAARYVSCFLFTAGAYSINSMVLGWVSATLGQTQEKKAVSLSIVNVVANASYIYTAYLYPKSDGPRYLTAMASNAAFAFACIAGTWALRFWLIHENKKMDRAGNTSGMRFAY